MQMIWCCWLNSEEDLEEEAVRDGRVDWRQRD